LTASKKEKEMEQTKQNLTALITRINDTLPDENDLKGFLGISKSLITDTLIQSDALLIPLKEYDNDFEVIVLKRELAEIFNKINQGLDEGFEKIRQEKFQSFLKQVTKIKFLIKESYISVASNTIFRTEAEIVKAKEEFTLLSSNNEELKRINAELLDLKVTTVTNLNVLTNEATTIRDGIVTINTEVNDFKVSSAAIVADLTEKQRVSTENEKTITEFLGTISGHKATVETIKENTTQWQIDIKVAKESLETKAEEFDKLNNRSKDIQKEIEATHEKIFGKRDEEGKQVKGYLQETEDLKKEMADFLVEQEKKFIAQFNEIKGLLPDATSAGLAAAYQKQKDSYTKPIQLWSRVFFGTIIIMTGLGGFILYSYFKATTEPSLNSALISLLKDLPFFIPTIWLAAFASKQQSQYKRLQQEYAFKETNAKSFHGHKEQIERLMKHGGADKDLLSQLVAQLVFITAQNPSNTLDNKSHEDNSPILKFAEKYIPFVSKSKPKE
jgi:hypothetical protein